MAQQRANAILKHIKQSSDSDIVIVSALRTPIGKARRGSFKDTHWTHLLQTVLAATVEKNNVPHSLIEDIVVGTCLPPGGGAVQARQAMFLAGFPEKVPITTLNRQCSSGLQSVANIVAAIHAGYIKCGIAAGVESMTSFDMVGALGEVNEKIFENAKAKDCLLSMGETSENVSKDFGISREVQDEFALDSQKKAVKAQEQGWFNDEIVPVKTKFVQKDGKQVEITVTKDDGPRKSTIEGLRKLRPAFGANGKSTAGNSSQTSDGAAAVLLMTRGLAKQHGLPILGTFVSYAVTGVPPRIMGVGPKHAIPLAVDKAGVKLDDIEVFEVNEAFASQAYYSVKELGIPMEKVNPVGGAIALGHPLGCTGSRQVATLLHYMRRVGKKGKLGVVSMCIGTGMGAAAVIRCE